MKEKLLKIEKMFTRYGFKSVTMNDIARELGISKKTLYQFVENKNDLIIKVVQAHIETEKAEIAEITSHSKNAIEQMLAISEHVNQNLKKINPSAIFDLQKYYRDAWEVIEDYRREYVFSHIKENVSRGIKEGIYRSSLDPNIIGRLYIGMMNFIIDKDLFPTQDYSNSLVYQACIDYHIRAIASSKGLELLESYQKDKNI